MACPTIRYADYGAWTREGWRVMGGCDSPQDKLVYDTICKLLNQSGIVYPYLLTDDDVLQPIRKKHNEFRADDVVASIERLCDGALVIDITLDAWGDVTSQGTVLAPLLDCDIITGLGEKGTAAWYFQAAPATLRYNSTYIPCLDHALKTRGNFSYSFSKQRKTRG